FLYAFYFQCIMISGFHKEISCKSKTFAYCVNIYQFIIGAITSILPITIRIILNISFFFPIPPFSFFFSFFKAMHSKRIEISLSATISTTILPI
ncbi:hypothetical protein EDC96DRAFT_535566, partial [Choanephora cucurbitarum]